MSVKIITKQSKPTGHVSPKRWMKYIARNEPLVKFAKPHKHSSRTNLPILPVGFHTLAS